MPDFFTKAIEVLKIPIKVLLPALWVFSGFLLFASDDFLEKINLFEWSNQNGFVFGLIFIVCSSFLLIYLVFFLKDAIVTFWNKLTLNRRLFKKIMDLNDVEIVIIAKIYTSTGYTMQLDYNQPIIKGLFERDFIFGGNQRVSASPYNSQMMVYCMLQPCYIKALDTYVPKIKTRIDNCKQKLSNCKNDTKKNEYKKDIDNMEYYYKLFMGI